MRKFFNPCAFRGFRLNPRVFCFVLCFCVNAPTLTKSPPLLMSVCDLGIVFPISPSPTALLYVITLSAPDCSACQPPFECPSAVTGLPYFSFTFLVSATVSRYCFVFFPKPKPIIASVFMSSHAVFTPRLSSVPLYAMCGLPSLSVNTLAFIVDSSGS